MKAFTVARLGSDMEIRFLPSGEVVGQVSLAVRLSRKDKSGEYMTQWISASMFGKRAGADPLSHILTGSAPACLVSVLNLSRRI